MLPQDQSVQRAPEPFVQLHALGVTYSGGVQALRCIDLDFRAGTFVALLGQSGSGKSTLLRCINLLVRPTSGTVQSAGLPVLHGRCLQQHRLRTGMIFQQHQLNPRQTVLQNVLNGRLGRHAWWRTPPPRYSLGHPFGDNPLRGANEEEGRNPAGRGSGRRP